MTISWLDSWSGRAGYQVIVYDSGVPVYDSGSRKQSITEDTVNDYVVLSGSWPSVGFSGSTVTMRLSGGTDSDTVGVPLYYEDGTRVTLNDYLNYNITNILQMKSLYYGGSSADTINSSTLYADPNKFSFTADENDNLLLVYTGQKIDGILGFSFNWDQTSSSMYYDLIVACKYDSSYSDRVRPVNFSTTDGGNWWAEVMTSTDRDALIEKDCFYPDTAYGFYGEVRYNSNYTYKVMQFYSDLGNTPVELDVSKFYITERDDVVAISCIEASTVTVKTYKLRIYFR